MKRLLMLAGGAAVAVMMAGCVAVPYGGGYYDSYGYVPGYDAGYAPGYVVVPAPTVTFGVSGGYYGGGYYRGWHGRGRGWGWHH